MRFLLAGGNWYPEWKLIRKAAPQAEQLRFWAVLTPDHYMWTDKQGNVSLDAWVVLTYLAAQTRTLRLGTLVTPIPFRPPAILAKIVSTLDVVSGGRTILGVGAGWLRAEFEAYSKWNDAKVRVDQTQEGLELILSLWSKRTVNFHGRYYRARDAILEPKPLQKPHPPLLFGGEGPRMLRMAGRYADICFIPPWIDHSFIEARGAVEREAVRAGREKAPSFAAGAPSCHPPYLSPRYDFKQYLRRIEEAEENGCEYFVVPFPRRTCLDSMRKFAKDVIPSFTR